MRRFLSIVLVIAAILALCACAQTPGQTQPVTTQKPEQTNSTVDSQPTTVPSATSPTTQPTATEPEVATPVSHFEFEERGDGTYRIKKYLIPHGGDVIIPETYNNGKIVEIANYAFNSTEVHTIKLSRYISVVGVVAFQTCEVQGFLVDESNPFFCAVDGVLFNKRMTTLFRFPTTLGVTAYAVPEGVDSLEFGAFSNCHSLQTVDLPDSLREIDTMAFSYCTKLSGIELPNGLLSIGDGAFHTAEMLTQVTIPASVTSIGEKPFSGCNKLTQIMVDPQNTCYQSIDGVLFDKTGTILVDFPCGRTGEYQIPQGVQILATEAFGNCALTAVILPDSLQEIESLCFQSANELETIQFSGTVSQWAEVELGNFCFSGCDAEQITCSDGTVTIE